MIPGLSLPSDRETQLWERFQSWSAGFQRQLREDGIDGLLENYEALIRSMETHSCPHGPDGAINIGSDWQHCCGISYEYRNDAAVRTALGIILELLPHEHTDLRNKIATLDSRLRALMDGDPSTPEWWMHLPRGVEE